MDDPIQTKPKESVAEKMWREVAERHAAAIERGEHDDRCEVRERFFLCHCSKRRRERAGFTEVPGDLEFPPPYCPRCKSDCWHDGDGWQCPECPVSWPSNGIGAEFTDDYGDLTPPADAPPLSAPAPPTRREHPGTAPSVPARTPFGTRTVRTTGDRL